MHEMERLQEMGQAKDALNARWVVGAGNKLEQFAAWHQWPENSISGGSQELFEQSERRMVASGFLVCVKAC